MKEKIKKIIKEGDMLGKFIFLKELEGIEEWRAIQRQGYFECFCGKVIKGTMKSIEKRRNCWCKSSLLKSQRIKHGLARRGKEHPYWHTISGAYHRCYSPNNKDYPQYGWRWIKLFHERENDLSKFAYYLDNSLPPRKEWESLDRINNDGNYEPWNIRWYNQSNQCSNKRNNCLIEHEGQIKTLSRWAKDKGIKKSTLANRYHNIGLRWDELFKQKPYFSSRAK
jgi:hypothetical protein